MEKSVAFSDWLGEACNDYPILWAVYGLVLFLPAAILLYFVCTPKRLDAAARHKKTDEHTPKDTVIEKKSWDTEQKSADQKSADLAVNEENSVTESKKDTAKNNIKTGHIEAPNDEIKVQDDERIVEQFEATNDKNETYNNDIKTEAPNEERVVEQIEATNDETEISDDISNGPLVAEQDTESHDGQNSHEPSPPPEVEEPLQNGVQLESDEVGVVDADGACQRWSFPPVLDQFDLMDTETDPTELEAIFTDERMREIYLHVTQDGPRLGISIVGGQGSPSGDLPIVVKRILPGSLAEQDGRLKSGDELVAMDEKLLVGVAKDVAINALSNLDGTVRLLVLQDE